MTVLRAGIAQIQPLLGDVETNVSRHLEFIRDARNDGVDLLLFPELSLTGYDLRETAPDISINVDDEQLARLGRASGPMIVVFGFVELGFAAQLYNSAMATTQTGPLFVHRKLNLPTYGSLEEAKHFSSGRYVDMFRIKGPWYGSILLCADAWNPALVHLAAIKGATILLVPTNSATGTVKSDISTMTGWKLTTRFYAYIYGFPILMANRIGQESEYAFWGRSKVISPDGKTLKEASGEEEELLIADLNFRDTIRSRARLPTVRDSNLDLVYRELGRLRATIGKPGI